MEATLCSRAATRNSDVLHCNTAREALLGFLAAVTFAAVFLASISVMAWDQARPASAEPATTYSFNVLGLDNGEWGNERHFFSVDWFWDVVVAYDQGGWEFPMTSMFSEMCDDSNGWESQYSRTRARFLWVTGSTIAGRHSSQYGGYGSPCNRFGPAVLARAVSQNNVWRSGESYPYNAQVAENHQRRLVCVFPNWVFGIRYEACATHLTTNENTANAQLGEARWNTAVWSDDQSIWFGGDLNLSPEDNLNPLESDYSPHLNDIYVLGHLGEIGSGQRTYNVGHPDWTAYLTERLDFIFYRWLYRQNPGGTIVPRQSCDCGTEAFTLGNNRVSDHMLLIGSLGWSP